MTFDDLLGGPFDTVFDVGGNVGDFAENATKLWPTARVYSFEPVPTLAQANRQRSRGRWDTIELAVSDHSGRDEIHFCINQHSASTMQQPGSARREQFGIVDCFETVEVSAQRLDTFSHYARGRLLVKIDVEGHEAEVIGGAGKTLSRANTVVCEVQQDPTIFEDAFNAAQIDNELALCGLRFAGILDAFKNPAGAVVQFDGIWRRNI